MIERAHTQSNLRFFASIALTLIVLLSASVISTKAAQAEEIGRTTINGRVIILNDDNTWEYGSEAPAVSANCTDVQSEVLPISICLDPDKWTFASLGGEAEHKLRHKTEELYLLFITEKTVIDIPTLKKAAISNAQNASGLTKVKTLVDGSTIIGGKAFGQINYATTVDGLEITYANYNTSFKEAGSLQFVFFAATSQFDGFEAIINEVLAGVKVSN